MKNTYLGLLIALGITLGACQQDETNTVPPVTTAQTAALNWKYATPHTVFKSPYTGFEISKETLLNALAVQEVSSVRFVLETCNNQLQIRVVGVSTSGLKTTGKVITQKNLTTTLNKLRLTATKTINITASGKGVSDHILQPAQAATYIQAWQETFQNNALEELISYNGERIRYFSMPANVIQQMANAGDVQLVWGLNTEGKLATVFLPKPSENNMVQTYIYDFTEPCPSTCDEG